MFNCLKQNKQTYIPYLWCHNLKYKFEIEITDFKFKFNIIKNISHKKHPFSASLQQFNINR